MKLRKDTTKPLGILRAIVLITVGILIGSTVVYFTINVIEKVETIEVSTSIATIQEPIKEELLNPMIKLPYYKNHSWIKFVGIEELITNYLEEAKRGKKISSASVYFRDLTNDFKVGVNEDEQFSPASLMKVPIMIAVLKYFENKPYTLKTELFYEGPKEKKYIEIDPKVFVSKTRLISGNRYSVEQLIEIMITESDNEATILLIDYLEQEDPNFLSQVEHDLGMDIPENTGNSDNFLTVKRYASFFRTLFNASYLTDENSKMALDVLSKSGYGYGIRQSIPKNITVAHKFGIKLTQNPAFQLHHFGIVYHAKKPFLIGIMTKGNDLENLKRFTSDVGFDVFSQVEIQSNSNTNTNSYLNRDIED